MRILSNTIVAGLIAGAMALTSCADFLNIDNYFDDEFKIDSVFVNTRYMEAYMWGAAAMFPNEEETIRNNHTPGPMATDEAFNTYRVGNNVYHGLNFADGLLTSDYEGNTSAMNKWGAYYKIIRKCNNILANLEKPDDMTVEDRARIEGYTRFIRAYAYYNLLVDYGPPILLGDEIVNTNEDLAYYDRPRSTCDDAVEYTCSELEKAAAMMPATVSILDFGRPTRGAAFALVARLRLMHASPLFNGGDAARSYFGNWTRSSDDVHYVSQEYDERRWALAAAAARRVIDMNDAGKPLYALHTVPSDANTPALPTGVESDPAYYDNFPGGAAGIDHLKSYKDMFNGESPATVVSEFIWAKKAPTINDVVNKGTFPVSLSGWGRFCVPQKVIDAYLMDDGRTIEEARGDGYYSEEGFTAQPRVFSEYTLNSGVYNMYANREMRFYASIGFCEAVWKCGSTSDVAYKNHAALYYNGAVDGRGASTDEMNHSVTGYAMRKYVHDMDAFLGAGNSRVDKSYPIIRFAEILLSYAEALNNLTMSHDVQLTGEESSKTYSRDEMEIAWAFNQVRYRAGLPGLSDTQLAEPTLVQAQIERERMVEFLWENRRYYDVRRWGIYEETERVPIMGMNIDGGKSSFYQRVIPSTSSVRGRMVDKKLAFLPIPRNELRRLPSLDQNPGW